MSESASAAALSDEPVHDEPAQDIPVEVLKPTSRLSVDSRGDSDFEALKTDMESLIEGRGHLDDGTYQSAVSDAVYEEVDNEDEGEGPDGFDEGSDDFDDPDDIHTVVVDGAESQVPLKELKAGYQRQADYTRKTQVLAEERRQLQSERDQYHQLLSAVAANLNMTPDAPPDEALFQSNPAAYVQARDQWQHRSALRDAVAQEQARLGAVAAAETAWASEQHRRMEDERLAAAIPEWHDTRARDHGKAELVNYLKSQYQASDDEIGVFTDHRLVLLALKAKKYDELQNQKGLALKKVRSTPRVQRPGAARTQHEIDQAYVQAVRDRFYRTGSMEDAAELIKYIAD